MIVNDLRLSVQYRLLLRLSVSIDVHTCCMHVCVDCECGYFDVQKSSNQMPHFPIVFFFDRSFVSFCLLLSVLLLLLDKSVS